MPSPPANDTLFAKRRRAWQKLVIFLILVGLFSGSLALGRLLIPDGTNLLVTTWSPAVADLLGMWSVGVAAVAALMLIDRSIASIGFRPPARKYLIIGCAVPLAYCVAIYLPLWLIASVTFAGPRTLTAGVVSGFVHLPRNLFAAAGEELGWRGVLVPSLALLARPSVIALAPGALWAVWHYPDIVFFGYNVGTPSAFALTCFSIGIVGTGAFMSWLRLASGSIWPCIIFHGVHNSLIWGVFERATVTGGVRAYVTSEFGVGFALVGVAVGFWSIRYGRIEQLLSASRAAVPKGGSALLGDNHLTGQQISL